MEIYMSPLIHTASAYFGKQNDSHADRLSIKDRFYRAASSGSIRCGGGRLCNCTNISVIDSNN